MSNLSDFFGGGELKWWDEIYENKVEITTSQDWTVPPDVDEVVVGICGGGGAGAASYDGGGGGGSKMTYHVVAVTPGETITVAIGAGGVYPSGDGGASSFGAYVSVDGGAGYIEDNISGNNDGRGGNGGSPGGFSTAYKIYQSPPLVVEKIQYGRVVQKQIFPFSHKPTTCASGGCGGGYDYEGIGGSRTSPATGYGAGGGQYATTDGDGTSGICVIWY